MANRYVIRFKNAKSGGRESTSEPIDAQEVKRLISKGRVGPDDDISIYPNEFFMRAKDYSEFEDLFRDDEKTVLFDHNKTAEDVHEEKTRLFERDQSIQSLAEVVPSEVVPLKDENLPSLETQKQKTMIFELPQGFPPPAAKKGKLPKRSFLVLALLALLMYEFLFDDDSDQPRKQRVTMTAVRPQLPSGGTGQVDPERSVKVYLEGMKPYAEDTVQGYRRAVDVFQLALKLDPQNVKALALLASSYLNLIDSSNKDEKTFSVINKLIELSRVKDLNLVETMLAEVEFLAATLRYDAAIQKLTDYSKVTGKFDPILYFYLSWLYSLKGENDNAMRYLNLIPAVSLPIPKLYYLRGSLLEQGGDLTQADAEYLRALKINPNHAKSILGLIRVSEKKGTLKNMLRYDEFLTSNPSLQSPKEYVEALIYRSKLALLFQQPDAAVQSLEKALEIEPKNEDLRLEYYTLLSQSGKDSRYQKIAKMFALVLEGERDLRAGKKHEAVLVLLQAKDSFPKSNVPLIKMGDLFISGGEYSKAIAEYKKALELNPKSGEVAVKLIDALIRNHEWSDAGNLLARYRSHPALKSSIDRLAGDLAFHQGNYNAAIEYYRKAMARDTIDTEVYSSYATALREMNQCKDAQFFYSIARRMDPFNDAAVIGIAKCLLKTDSVAAAVGRIQDELSKAPKARASLLAGIAEIYYLAREDEQAIQFIEQAKNVDADYAVTYKIEGDLYQRAMGVRKDAEKKALEAFKAYSDRNVSDPYGYLQRFEIFMKSSNFDQANEELNKVFEVSPRYPELHFLRSQLYTLEGRSKEALVELEAELKMNPRMVKALVEEGNLFVRGGHLDDAMKDFVKAMQIDPQNASAKVGAGYVNYLKHQYPSAIALLSAAIAIDKGNPDTYKKLGYAYRDSGDPERAAQAFRNYLDLAPDAPDRAEFEH